VDTRDSSPEPHLCQTLFPHPSKHEAAKNLIVVASLRSDKLQCVADLILLRPNLSGGFQL
jgi:hypothetical protein